MTDDEATMHYAAHCAHIKEYFRIAPNIRCGIVNIPKRIPPYASSHASKAYIRSSKHRILCRTQHVRKIRISCHHLCAEQDADEQPSKDVRPCMSLPNGMLRFGSIQLVRKATILNPSNSEKANQNSKRTVNELE